MLSGSADNQVLTPANYVVEVSSQGCTATLNFDVKSLPDIAVILDWEGYACKNDDATLTASTSGGDGNYTYRWRIGGILQAHTTEPVLNIASITGTMFVELAIADASGCTAQTSQKINTSSLKTYSKGRGAIEFSVIYAGYKKKGSRTFF